jgi:hypothetical protein
MRIKPVTESGTGYVGLISENYIAVACVLNWLYGRLNQVAAKEEDGLYSFPEKANGSWKGDQCKAWFQAHKIAGYTKLRTVVEMNEQIAALLEAGLLHKSTGDLPLAEPEETASLSAVEDMIMSMAAMISHAIVDEVMTARAVALEWHVLIFLSCFHCVDKLSPKEKPKWIESYNFVSLKKMAEEMLYYQPLTLVWDGDGAKVLQTVKQVCRYGIGNNFASPAARQYFREKSIKEILVCAAALLPEEEIRKIPGLNNDDDNDNDDEQSDGNGWEKGVNAQNQTKSLHFCGFCSHLTEVEARSAIVGEMVPILACILGTGQLVVPLVPDKNGTKKCLLIVADDNDSPVGTDVVCCGTHYFKWHPYDVYDMPAETDIVHYGLMLPWLWGGVGSNSYYTITHTWLKVGEGHQLHHYHMRGARY